MTWVPFELHPDTPPEGVELAKYFGAEPAAMERMYRGLKERAEELGLPLNPPPILANTHKALMLAEGARDAGKLDQLHMPLFQAYFVDGRNLADEDLLISLAAKAGMDADAARAALTNPEYDQRIERSMAESRAYGVTGAPTFIIADRFKVVGAQPYERLRDALRNIAQEK